MALQQKKIITANKRYAILWHVPIVAILAVTPLIVYLSVHPVPEAYRSFWFSDINFDFFSFYKSRWFIFWSVMLLLSFVFWVYKRKGEYPDFVQRSKWFWMAWVLFAVSILLSAVFSPVPPIAWAGMFDHYEGGWVWLAYCLLLAACAFLPRQDADFRYFTGAFYFSTTVIALIGAFQFFGMDLFRSDFGQWLILPEKFSTGNVSFAIEKGHIYSTFFNPNYGGNIVGISLPLAVCRCLFVPNFKKSGALLLGYSLLLFILAIGCRSQSGIMGLFIAFAFMIIYLARHYRNKFMRLAMIIALFAPVYFGMDMYAAGAISRQFTSRFLGDGGVLLLGKTLLINVLDTCKSHVGAVFIFIAVIFMTIYLARHYRNKFMRLAMIIALFAPIYLVIDMYVSGPVSEKFSDAFMHDKSVVHPSIGHTFNDEQKRRMQMLPKNKTFFDEKIIEYGHFAGGRFYIFIRSLELQLKKHSFLGTGPDTFVISFPQDDVYRFFGGFQSYELIDKMHSMFLQIWFNTGIISFVAFMIMLIVHFANSVRVFWKVQVQTYIEVVGLGLFLGWTGFLGAALFNDSAISVSPYFWAVFGASIAANHVMRFPTMVFTGDSVPDPKQKLNIKRKARAKP